MRKTFQVVVALVLIGADFVTGGARAETIGSAVTPKWGKYPNSLLIRTRTAATYQQGLSVFTLVGLYEDFTEGRNPRTGKMEDLPGGMEREQTTTVIWGEYAITGHFQVGLGLPIIDRSFKNEAAGVDEDASGPADMSLNGKIKVMPETRWCPGITLDGFLKLPTGDEDDGLGNGEIDTEFGLSFSKRCNAFSVHFNPAYTVTGGDKSEIGASADDRFRFNCGLMWHFAPTVLPAVEWNGMWWGDVGEQQEIGGGVLWFPFKNISVKVAVAVPVNTDLPWKTGWTPWIKVATWF